MPIKTRFLFAIAGVLGAIAAVISIPPRSSCPVPQGVSSQALQACPLHRPGTAPAELIAVKPEEGPPMEESPCDADSADDSGLPDGTEAADSEDVSDDDAASAKDNAPLEIGDRLFVTQGDLKLRHDPDEDAAEVMALPIEAEVVVRDVFGAWARVVWHDDSDDDQTQAGDEVQGDGDKGPVLTRDYVGYMRWEDLSVDCCHRAGESSGD